MKIWFFLWFDYLKLLGTDCLSKMAFNLVTFTSLRLLNARCSFLTQKLTDLCFISAIYSQIACFVAVFFFQKLLKFLNLFSPWLRIFSPSKFIWIIFDRWFNWKFHNLIHKSYLRFVLSFQCNVCSCSYSGCWKMIKSSFRYPTQNSTVTWTARNSRFSRFYERFKHDLLT